jgi:hypothetical protein
MRLSLLLCLVISLSVAAAEPHPLAAQALDKLDQFEWDNWSYTQTTTDAEGTRIERHDASKPDGERWSLLRINGRAPNGREVESFRKEKAERARRKKESDDRGDVDRSSVRLLTETAQRATFTFRTSVTSDGIEAKFADKIAGTLVVNKDGAWAERFELKNTEAVSPIPGVKVSSFHLTLTFQRHAPSKEIVPAGIALSMRGRAFLVKSLDQEQSTRFSDFLRVR